MPKRTTGGRPELKAVNVGAAAIDIGSKMHMAAVNSACADVPVRSFGTFTQDLHELADWFKACGVTSVAMESTGVYWIPVYEILEQRGFDVILVNARYAKNVPGRKTDVSDAAWLRELHSYGLLTMAIQQQRPQAGLIHHSDRGVQYASHAYRDALSGAGIAASMSRKADCYDNAPMESFFHTFKTELVHHRDYKTRAEAQRDIFAFIEGFYNRTRLHSAIGYIAPIEMELKAA